MLLSRVIKDLGFVQDWDDDKLLASIAGGNEAATQLLVDRHLSRTLALSYRMLRDHGEAEEVSQDAFLRVWKTASKWEPGRAKFTTWLHRVVTNLCIDRLRKRRTVQLDENFDIPDDSPDPEATLVQGELSGRVRSAMDKLPERQKTAILLSHYQGMSNIETAAILDVSIEAVESLLARGRRALKKTLRSEWDDIQGTAPTT